MRSMPPNISSPIQRRQRKAALAAALLSVIAHAWLLSPIKPTQAVHSAAAPTLRQGLQTRTLAAPNVTKPPASEHMAAPVGARQPPTPPAPAQTSSMDTPSPTGSDTHSPAAPETLSAAKAPKVSPAVEWRFLLLQDGRQGLARLTWLPNQDASYQLRLDRQLDGRPLPGWRSEGKVGPQGLLPERFAQQRRGRDAQATNFRRPEGLISFSANADVFDLPEGVQDRLSWWFQLAATLDAAPELQTQGARLHMTVIGLRGEARDWAFEVVGPELLDMPDRAALPTLHLHRPQIFAHSGEIDIWLDPIRRHLPVRLVYKLPDERSWELLLLDDGLPP
ncbi:DUF3108 domain-containing protein [Paucibacter sp. AS339]|uniref:DUF3108 domain-containing protein n=1 Tax=Paucibacter hankyongi TaxID=3133434 RepID=UPI0030A339AF